MLTVRDLTHLPDLELAVAAGAGGLEHGHVAARLGADRPDAVARGR